MLLVSFAPVPGPNETSMARRSTSKPPHWSLTPDSCCWWHDWEQTSNRPARRYSEPESRPCFTHNQPSHQTRTESRLTSQLSQSEELRDDLLGVLQGLGLATILTDSQGRITFISDEAARLLRPVDRQHGSAMGAGALLLKKRSRRDRGQDPQSC